MIDKKAYDEIISRIGATTTLVAVSKTKSISEIQALYELGHRDFGENYVQELLEKSGKLPSDIRWHFIGHLQSNKVKQIASFIHLIQSVDSVKLLTEVNKQAEKFNRIIDVLIQVHIADEETKYGVDEHEIGDLLRARELLKFVRIRGLMGMSTLTDDYEKVRGEFRKLASILKKHPSLSTLSMGMSGDYTLAIEEGSNMVRIGSLIFGERS